MVAAGLVSATLGQSPPSVGNNAGRTVSSQSTASSGLITITATIGDSRQQLTVIDPEKHVLSVYHIDLATGEIVLKSVRNIHWDLQMVEYNGTSPLPREIRSLLEQK
jgi:hypothetical protein